MWSDGKAPGDVGVGGAEEEGAGESKMDVDSGASPPPRALSLAPAWPRLFARTRVLPSPPAPAPLDRGLHRPSLRRHLHRPLPRRAGQSALMAMAAGDGDDGKGSTRAGRGARVAPAAAAEDAGKKRVRKPTEKAREEPVRGITAVTAGAAVIALTVTTVTAVTASAAHPRVAATRLVPADHTATILTLRTSHCQRPRASRRYTVATVTYPALPDVTPLAGLAFQDADLRRWRRRGGGG